MTYSPAIEAYIQAAPQEVQANLQQLRALIHELVPEVAETMSYQIPTFVLNGNLVHFAVFQHHIGFYPGPSGVAHVATQLNQAGYRWAKGSIQIPLTQPMPWELLREIIIFRAHEQMQKKAPASRQRK